MKENAEREIDLLLRRHARREGGAARVFDDGGSAKDDASRRAGGGAHLDADELNAFAEGVLPAPARARYASHLADCDSCRKVVTELALANSAATEGERAVAAPVPAAKSSWREWLAALFSPPVLRFAVPAFGLVAVAFILFVVTQKQRNESTLVARNQEEQVAQGNANTSAAPQEYKSADSSAATQPNASREPAAQDQNRIVQGEQSGVTVPPAQKPSATSDAKNPEQEVARTEAAPAGPTPVDKVVGGNRDEDRRDEEAQRNIMLRERGRAREEDRAAAAISPPPAQPSAGVFATTKEKEAELAKEAPKDQPSRSANNEVLDGASADNNEINAPQNKGYGGGKTPNATPSARKRAARPNTTTETKSGADDTRDNASETRRVGGRTFRRQGGAWVDTAYNSSRATVTVRRGTEQYRALVADEPAIGSISNQLGGEVIIVWKDRAYRIGGEAATGERSERKRNE